MEQNSLKPSAAADANGIVSDASVKEYLKSFPEGYQFVPTDIELVEEYLMKKINNETLPPNLIHEVNLYNKDPAQLTAEYDAITETEWYFFSPRDKKYMYGSRPNRATPNGYWKPSGTRKPIPHVSNHPIGYKTTLDFHAGRPPLGTKTIWKMYEYVVKDNNDKSQNKNGMTLDDWVLCKIYKRKPRRDEKTTTATQPSTVNVAHNNKASLMVENNNSFEDQNWNASQPILNVSGNNGPSLMVENNNLVFEDRNWNASQPMANISGNKGASLVVGNNNLAFEDQNWNAFQPTTPNQGPMHDWNVSQPTPYQGQMHEDQNWNVSQPTSYQRRMLEGQKWNASQPILNVSGNKGPSLMVGNNNLVFKDQNWNSSQPMANISGNKGASLMVGNNNLAFEDQNWNASQPTTPYQGPMHDWNVSQPPSYQGLMHEDQNWNASQPNTPNQGPMHEDQNWKVSQPTPYQGQLHEALNWNVSQPTPYHGPVHEVQNWNVSQPTHYQGPRHEDQNRASFWDCDFDTLDDLSSEEGISIMLTGFD